MDYAQSYDFCNPYLVGDEYILWKGKPEKGNLFTSSDIFLLPFSIFWLSFSLFWETTALLSGAPFFFLIWGLPFIAIGIYLLFGRFIHNASLRKKTLYVITNKKIIVKRGNEMKMYEGNSLPPMTITFHKNGNGTIRFSDAEYSGRGSGVHASPTNVHIEPAFLSATAKNRGYYTNYLALENLADVVSAQNAIEMMEN